MNPSTENPNPLEVLGLGPDASAADAKSAYLQAIRRFPPEREPQQFKRIRAAYEAVRTEEGLVEAKLFSLWAPPIPEAERARLLEPPRSIEYTDLDLVQDLVAAHLQGGSRLLAPSTEA